MNATKHHATLHRFGRLPAAPIKHAELELTILMPCLNEAQTLGFCIRMAQRYLQCSGVVGEILVADNGSTDGSQAIALAEGAQVLHVRNRGYGAALRAGIEAARGRFIIMADSDRSYDFSALDGFVERLRAGDKLVMGNRFAGGIHPGAMPPLHRYLGNPVLSFVGRLFFRSPVRDFHCGLRGFDRRAMLALDLQSSGMEFASEMVVKASLAKLTIGEVPTTLSPDGRDRPPHLRSWRDGWRHLRFLLLHAPAWLFMYPGLFLLTVGLVGSVALALGPVSLVWFTLDVHSMLYLAVAACLGLQMIMFAAASSSHAISIGVLPASPAPPRGIRWIQHTSLEVMLLGAFALLLLGLAFAAASVMLWSQNRFGAIDPARLMRVVIPAAMLMLAAGQVAMSAFLFEVIRLSPRHRSAPDGTPHDAPSS